MIIVTQYFHFPNNTELGKGTTHECYLLIPNSYDLSKIFPPGEEVEVIDTSSQKKYYLKASYGREFRINQFGQLYRDYDVHMGDEIILTHIDGEERRTYVNVNKHNRIVIKQGKNGGEIFNIERLTSFKKGNEYEIPIIYGEQELTLTIKYKESLAKRNDSPELTDYYTVKIGDLVIPNGSYLLSLGEKNELITFEKTNIISFPFDESIIIKESVVPNTTQETKHYQIIYYGAPGTGKSHTINNTTKQQPKENVFRTTFHPDSDYSTFVGCYKPTMINKEPLYKVGELINKLSEIKTSGETYPCHKFAAKYWESLKDLSADEIKKILTACGLTESMTVEIEKGIAIGEDFAKKSDNKKIVYSFVPQSFTKAYLRAWQTTEPVYLVIEEINRGNCAQIFGDLFQLLDRKCDGFSEYPIKADNDLAAYIAEKLSASSRADIPELVRSGEELMLPSNLYIWATMNTSDQSLFPIDSAFKRRWEWKYIPIDTKKENWVINVDGTNYEWSDFLEKINAKIESATSSEDKMLGFYFCKAENNIIGADRFVSKVLFYLWNDVFKDYGFDDAIFNDENNQKLSFRKFYKVGGNVDENKVKKFLDNLQVKVENEGPNGEDENSENTSGAPEKQLRFWQGFNNSRNTNQDYCNIYTEQAPLGQPWMNVYFGTSAYHPFMNVKFNKSVISAGIEIQGTARSSEIFEHFKENENAINAIAGVGLIFRLPQKPKNPSNPSYSIYAENKIDVNDESTWEEAYNWMMDMAVKMNEIKEKFGV